MMDSGWGAGGVMGSGSVVGAGDVAGTGSALGIGSASGTGRLEQIARTLLYEGYLLWPYRRSAIKNRRRWTIGGVYPPDFEGAERSGDRSDLHCECLIEGDAAPAIDLRVRFLHRVMRQVTVWDGASLEAVDELRVGDEHYLTWDEAVEREVRVRVDGVMAPISEAAPIVEVSPITRAAPFTEAPPATEASPTAEAPQATEAASAAASTVYPISIPAGRHEEWLAGPGGERVGALIRRWEALEGVLEVAIERLAARLYRVRARFINRTSAAGLDREAALGRTFIAAHLALEAVSGEFVSLLDPPPAWEGAVATCRNLGCWPVLVGEEGERHTMLASPVIVYDYPQIAPESPGDLFDGTEIDQLLILNVLGMTEAEKAEMRASDPRAREILERSEGISPEEMRALFGAVREYREVEDGEP